MRRAIVIVLVFSVAILIFLTTRNSSQNIVFEKNNVMENVNILFTFAKSINKKIMDDDYSFVYFKYTIDNGNRNKLYFNPGKIRVKYNGEVNTSTEYDSIASAMTESVELPKGKQEYFLSLVFKNQNISLDIKEFEIINTGISKDKENDHGKD